MQKQNLKSCFIWCYHKVAEKNVTTNNLSQNTKTNNKEFEVPLNKIERNLLFFGSSLVERDSYYFFLT